MAIQTHFPLNQCMSVSLTLSVLLCVFFLKGIIPMDKAAIDPSCPLVLYEDHLAKTASDKTGGGATTGKGATTGGGKGVTKGRSERRAGAKAKLYQSNS